MLSTNFFPQHQDHAAWQPDPGWSSYSPSSVSSPTVSLSPYVQFTSQDETLSRIYEVANHDVEMQDVPSSEEILYVVIDTNILIDNLPMVERFCGDVETMSLPIMIIIPIVVLSELDGLKNRDSLKWFSQTASTFILKGVRKMKSIKVQARKETSNIKDQEDLSRKNDIAIFDCCHYFSQKKGRVVLLSADKNLCIECEKEKIMSVNPPKRSWSSRELARALFDAIGVPFDISRFYGHEWGPSYRRDKTQRRAGVTEAPRPDDDDRMEVDDYWMTELEEYTPSHALDALHVQVIKHFTIVIKELAERVRKEYREEGPVSQSKHAPGHRRKEFKLWSLGDCLDYLGEKKKLTVTQPSLKVFLLLRNENYGWRRGQDWSRQDWVVARGALQDIGETFKDGPVLNSLEALRPHVDAVFETPMRPT